MYALNMALGSTGADDQGIYHFDCSTVNKLTSN